MGLLDDLKKEAKKVVKDANKLKKKTGRALYDELIEPPSTTTQIERYVKDMWEDEVKQKAVGKEFEKVIKDIGNEFNSLIGNNKTESSLSEGFDKICDKLDKLASKSPVIKKLSNFFKKAAELVESLTESPKTKQVAWESFKKSASELGAEIQKTVVGPSKSASRAR